MKKIAADRNYRMLKMATRRGTFGPIYDKALDLAREDGWYEDGGDRTGDMEPFYSHHVYKDKLLQTDLVEMYWDKAEEGGEATDKMLLDFALRDGWQEVPGDPVGLFIGEETSYKDLDTGRVLSEKGLIKAYRDNI